LKDKKHWEVPLVADSKPLEGIAWSPIEAAADRLRLRLTYSWELKQLTGADLKPGDVLEYFLSPRITSILMVRGTPRPSGRLRIAIISQEDFANRVTEELRTLAGQVNVIRGNQLRTRQETVTLKQDTERRTSSTAPTAPPPSASPISRAPPRHNPNKVATKLDAIRSAWRKTDLCRRLEEHRQRRPRSAEQHRRASHEGCLDEDQRGQRTKAVEGRSQSIS
jgi:hypothetical protein